MKLLLAIFAAALLIMITGCTSTPQLYPRSPLIDQEMRFRPSFDKGPTHQICAEIDPKTKNCARMDVATYDLTDQATRDRLVAVKLICKVGLDRMRVCPAKPGLCMGSWWHETFLGFTTKRWYVEDKYLPVPEKTQELIDRKARCASLGSLTERGFW